MPPPRQDLVYEFGGFRLNPLRRILLGPDTRPIALQPRVFDTLLFFVENSGELLDKQTLMQAVWPQVVVEENSLNQHISTLRRIFGEQPGDNRFIVTIPGRGYRFVAGVRALDAGTDPAGTIAAAAATIGQRQESRPPGSRAAAVGLLAVGLLVAIVAARYVAETRIGASAKGDAARGSPAAELVAEARNITLRRQGAAARDDALALLDVAIELDPIYAPAYSEKARLYLEAFNFSVLPVDGSSEPGFRDAERQARMLAKHALELDPEDDGARQTLAAIDIFTWHWASFERRLTDEEERRLRLVSLWVLSWLGRHEDAIRIGEQIAAREPGATDAHFGLGVVYAYAGEYRAAIRSVNRALESASGNALGRTWVALCETALGDVDAALVDLKLVEELLGEDRMYLLPDVAYGYWKIGHADEARRVFDEIAAIGAEADIGTGAWALAYLAIGDEASALEWLERAAEKASRHMRDQGIYDLMYLKLNVLRDKRLEKPEFQEVLGRIRGH